MFQSTRPVWGATGAVYERQQSRDVSIHAPRVGRDERSVVPFVSPCGFNPRAPCGARLEIAMTIISVECFNPRAPCGARPTSLHGGDIPRWFQSTRPVWGATTLGLTWEDIDLFQSTRPVWGATFVTGEIIRGKKFQSTRPVWGATLHSHMDWCGSQVSIHAPRVGRDGKRGHDFPPLPRIYVYSPPQIRFSRHLRPTPLLRHDSRTYIFTFCFLFTSPSHSVINAQMIMAASKS